MRKKNHDKGWMSRDNSTRQQPFRTGASISGWNGERFRATWVPLKTTRFLHLIQNKHITRWKHPSQAPFSEKFTLKRKICNDRSLPNVNSHVVMCKLKGKAVVCNGFPLCYFANLKFTEPLKGFVMTLIKKSVLIYVMLLRPPHVDFSSRQAIKIFVNGILCLYLFHSDTLASLKSCHASETAKKN